MGPKFLIYQLHPAKPIFLGRFIKFTAVLKNVIVFSKYVFSQVFQIPVFVLQCSTLRGEDPEWEGRM
jgi:hypothetical protein